jgi:transposase
MKKLGELLDAVVIERPWPAPQAAPAGAVAPAAALVPAGAVAPAAALVPAAPMRVAATAVAGVALATQPTPGAATRTAMDENRCLDRGFDYNACRQAAQARGSTVHIPAKASTAQPLPAPGDPERQPPRRWVVEVTHSWLNRFRRLLVRWEQDAANYLGFVHLAACLIIYRKLRHVRSLSG